MCDHDSTTPSVDQADATLGSLSRRRFLQAGAVLGALAVAPTTEIIPLLPDPGKETPGPEPQGRGSGIVVPQIALPTPPIVTRGEWGADESRRGPDGDYSFDSVVTKIVVHHTVTPNSASDDASIVRGIYNYHTSPSGGYMDIAYSFLIGRDGRLFEGRWSRNYAPGVPHIGEDASGRNVRAAHSTATNTRTIGVALLGDYRYEPPTPQQLETLAVFLAWKCGRWGLSPFGASVYLDGRQFPDIAGHRDVTATSCPGDGMYVLLDSARHRATNKLRSGAFGYWAIGRTGVVGAFGDLPDLGDPQRSGSAFPIAGIAARPGAVGFWAVSTDGGIFTFGNAPYLGSMGGTRLNQPIVGIAATPSGNGYWLVASDGGIFSFGDARFYGSTGSIRLNRPIVGMTSTPTGRGYWLVASDGGIFAFGDARFYGSTGSIRLNRAVVGMAATPSGNGYWLVASDGGIFAFGDARFYGSTGSMRLNQPIVGMASTTTGRGYWLVAADGGIFTFGDAPFYGSASVFENQCVGIARRP